MESGTPPWAGMCSVGSGAKGAGPLHRGGQCPHCCRRGGTGAGAGQQHRRRRAVLGAGSGVLRQAAYYADDVDEYCMADPVLEELGGDDQAHRPVEKEVQKLRQGTKPRKISHVKDLL